MHTLVALPPFLLGELVLWWILENECVDLVPHVHITDKPTGLALQEDALFLDLHDSLWVAATIALDILLYERFKQLAQLFGVVGSIDDGGAEVLVIVGLGTQLAPIELENVCAYQSICTASIHYFRYVECPGTPQGAHMHHDIAGCWTTRHSITLTLRWASQRLGNVDVVDNIGLDSISTALNLHTAAQTACSGRTIDAKRYCMQTGQHPGRHVIMWNDLTTL